MKKETITVDLSTPVPRIHRSYELVERRTGIIEVILRIFTIKIWDGQGK